MPYDPDDTICAIATAPGRAARGMVRLSGPHAMAVARRALQAEGRAPLERLRQPTAVHGDVRINLDGRYRGLPCELFVWPSDRSYTREPVVELHTIGSPPLLEAVVAEMCAGGARLAEPGEFTLRAFLAGRIDLTQAEAVLGVIDARAADDLGAALAQLAGGLARPLHQLRDGLLQLLAELEAGLDFVEEDIEFVSREEIERRLRSAALMLGELGGQMASRHTEAIDKQIVLLGRPNAGKSTLFNALVKKFGIHGSRYDARQVVALVSPQSGTTRDYLTATISLDEVRCELVDTAGVDEQCYASETADASPGRDQSLSSTDIAGAARSMAEHRRRSATLRVLCVDAVTCVAADPLADMSHSADYDLIALTKCDLLQHRNRVVYTQSSKPVVVTSGISGEGLEELCRTLRGVLTSERTSQRGQAVAATAGRCRESIRLAGTAITRAAEIASGGFGNELLAVEIRTALNELGKVVGAVYTDDLLDRIFKTFCIGK